MNYPQKRNINVAAASKRKHDLSHYHVGTTDFGRMKPIECRYLVPGDDFNYNINVETRVLNALPSPTIGQFDFVYRAFFVPIHNIWSPFYDFIKNQQTSINGVLTNVISAPYITLGSIYSYLNDIDNGLAERVQNPSSVADYDFSYTSGTSTVYRKFTKKGRILFDFLTSLGINIPLNGTEGNQKLYIILPLVAFWKFYFDWIVPSRFVREHEDYIQLFIDKLHSNVGSSSVTADDFFTYLVHEPLCYFLDDYFTSATLFPFSDPTQQQDTISIDNPSDVDYGFTPVRANNEYDYLDGGSGSYSILASDAMNMYTLQTLGKLQDLLNRNLIAGTKVQDWLLTEFGIRPNNDALHLSTYLGSKRHTLQISDVLSNADTLSSDGTTGAALGSYGGYLNNRSGFDFSYKAQEHGFFFITAELVPKTSYYQGLAAQFDMGDRFDFFQPEFDNQQGAPVPFRRLMFSQNKVNESNYNDIPFGFQLQYGDQKFAYDIISGDFRTRFGLELKSWFLGRDMSYLMKDPQFNRGITENFCLVKTQYQDWHYIFSDMTDELDPFLVAFYMQVHALRPMKSITEGFEPEYKNGNKDVTLDMQGSVK